MDAENISHLLFSSELRRRITDNLGTVSPRLLALQGRRRAAVCIALLAGADGEACFLLQRRAAALRGHAGQWALPGGRVDEGEDPLQAALRELAEEVCLTCGPSDVLGRLDDYATRSGYVISPFVVWAEDCTELCPNEAEVAALHQIPVRELVRPDSPHFANIPESDRPVIRLPLGSQFIHAPTAAYLYQFREAGLYGRHTPVAHFEQPVFAWR